MSKLHIAERILKIRKDKGFSQKKIFEISGINQGFLSEVEQNKAVPGSNFLLLFHAKFDVNINWLLKGEGEPYNVKKSRGLDDDLTPGERVKKIRDFFNLTQDGFGKKLSVNHSFISRIEKNNSAMGAEFLYELSNQFNVNINWLLAGDGPMFLSGLRLVDPVDPNVADSSTTEERTNKLLEMIAVLGKDMTEEQLRDVLKYAEEKKRLGELEELTKNNNKRA